MYELNEDGKGYFHELRLANMSSCEMLDFGAKKCDLFCACKALILIKMLQEMKIIGNKMVNCDSAVQIVEIRGLSRVITYWGNVI